MSQQLKVLALVTDAYGGTGGIAQYSRDFVEAVATHPSVDSVTVIPRVIAREVPAIPPGITHVADAANSKIEYAKKVYALAKKGAFDLVICGHINLLPLAMPAAKRIGARIILLVYGAEVWERKNRLVRSMVSRVDAVISISRFTLSRMEEWAAIKQSFIVPNAIHLEAFDAKLSAPYPVRGSPVLLTLGRMEKSEKGKGFDEVIEAISELALEYPEITYYAAGDGNDRQRLMIKARELGVERFVVFPGYVSEDEKPALFRAADVYVMPGRLEGFGYVFLEALAAGTPVIGSELDASREAMRDGKWGAVVNPGDRSALLAAIRNAIANPEVPPRSDLEYFSTTEFQSRTHSMLNTIVNAATKART